MYIHRYIYIYTYIYTYIHIYNIHAYIYMYTSDGEIQGKDTGHLFFVCSNVDCISSRASLVKFGSLIMYPRIG